MSKPKLLLDYLKKLPVDQVSRDQFAEKCGTSWAYLKQVAYGNKSCQAWLAINIERESESQVRCEQICTEQVDWDYIRMNSKVPVLDEQHFGDANLSGDALLTPKTNHSHTTAEQIRETESAGARATAIVGAA